MLAGLVVIEAGLAVLGLLGGGEPEGRPRAPGVAVVARAETPAVPRGELAGRVLARPLFVPGRRVLEAVAAVAAVAQPAKLPRLAGIVMAGALRRAVFALPGEEWPVSVGQGDLVGLFRVCAIGADWVELAGPFGRQVVRPGRDAALRERFAANAAPVALVDPYRRELETENDQ